MGAEEEEPGQLISQLLFHLGLQLFKELQDLFAVKSFIYPSFRTNNVISKHFPHNL